jgi:RecA-family ATPase
VLANGRKAVLTPLSEIRMKRTRWMWDKRIAMNTLSLVAGQPSMGKSTFVYWMVAALTNGELHGEYQGKSKDVVLCCTEDDFEATIKPRLAAAKADLTRVYQIDIKAQDEVIDGLNLVEDLATLKAAANDLDLGLVVFDPLMSRLGGKDSHKDSEVRQALEPLTKLAMECQFCVVGLIHFNKSGQSGNPLNMLMGSAAFGAVARSVHVVMQDPEDETGARRLLGTIKNNLGKTSGDSPHDLSTYAFTIQGVEMPTEEAEDAGAMLQTSCLQWEEASEVTVQDALSQSQATSSNAAPRKKAESKQDTAAKWLRHLFETRDTPLTKSEVLAAAARDMLSDHNEQNLGRAIKRDEFHVERKYAQSQGGVIAVWGLKEQFG